MDVSREDLSRHYASLSDEALLSIDENELTDVGQDCYAEELRRRHLSEETEPGDAEGQIDDEDQIDAGEDAPDWLDTAATACSFQVSDGREYAKDAKRACTILREAGIPSQVVGERQDGAPDLLNVLVPGALSLKATSVLDRDLFNEEMEETWRAHFDDLSDEELSVLDADDICAGLLDRAARLKRVFEEALARRNGEDAAEEDSAE